MDIKDRFFGPHGTRREMAAMDLARSVATAGFTVALVAAADYLRVEDTTVQALSDPWIPDASLLSSRGMAFEIVKAPGVVAECGRLLESIGDHVFKGYPRGVY